MADIVDKAAELEQQRRDAAIAAARQRSNTLPPKESTAGRHCLDCDSIIPAARVEAMPSAVRCIRCQQFEER